MTLNFEDNTEGTLDFETPVEQEVSYPSSAANDLATMGSYLNEGDLGEDFVSIKSELQITGKSQILQDIRDRDVSYRKEALVSSMKDILLDAELTPEERASDLKAATELAGDDAARPVWKMFQDEIALNYDETDPELADIQKNRWSDLDEIHNVQEIIEEVKLGIIDTKSGSFEGSVVDLMGDLTEDVVPFRYATTVQELYTHMMGEEPSWLMSKLAPGENMHALKEAFQAIPTAQGKVEWATKMAAFLKTHPGLIKDNNGFESFILINSLLDSKFDPGEDFDVDRLADNIVGILDATMVGGALARGVKNPLSALGIINRGNPELASKIQAAVIKSEDPEALKALNLTREQAIKDGHFPGTNPKLLDGAPSDVVEAITEIDEDLAGIVKSYLTDNPTQARRLKEIAEEYGQGKIRINDTTITMTTDTEAVVKVVVGRTRNSGYVSEKGARAAAKLRGLDDSTLVIMERNPSTGKIKEIKESTGESGEFFYQFSKVEEVPAETPFVDLLDVKTFGGTKTRNFLDIFSMFKKEDALKLSGIEDLKHGVLAQVHLAGKHFDSLGVKGKEKVLGYLSKGSKEGRTYSFEELVAGNDGSLKLTNQEYVAYSNLRAISDLVYHTENSRLTGWLKNNNYHHLVGTDNVTRYGIKGEASDLKGVTAVIDAKTGKPIELTTAMKESVQSGEGEVFKLRSKEGKGTERYEYVLVTKENANRVKPIPNQSLPYIDGYTYRKYTDNFFIERIDPRVTVNGGSRASKLDQTSVVGSAEKQSDAMALMSRIRSEALSLEEIEAGVTLRVRLGREVIGDMGDGEAIFQFAGMNGLLHKGSRGPLLNKLEGANGGLLPVVDSIQSSMNKAAANLSIKPMVEKLEKDFVALFGEKLGFIPRGSDGSFHFPLDKKQFNPGVTVEELKVHKKMLASWEYIHFLGRFEDPVTKNWRASLLTFGNWMDQKGWHNSFLTKTLEKASKNDPLDVLKGATFTGFLALNPIRQLFVQLSQHSMLAALDPAYIASGRLYKDTAAMMYGAGVRHNKKLWDAQKSGLARARGLSVKAYTKEVDDWMNSGLPSGIDSHSFLAGITLNSTEIAGRTDVGKALAVVSNTLKAPVRFSRKAGFNFGEALNLAMSWHVGRRRLEQGGKAFTGVDVANEARALSFGMNRAGEFAYQRGYLKLTTQFFSMQHKAMLIVMNAGSRGKFGNRFFTKEEAFRMAALQTLMFGFEGLGVYGIASWAMSQYEEMTGEEMDTDVREALISGVGTHALNNLLNATSDNLENTRLNFGSFAVLSGSTMLGETVADMLFKTNESGIQSFMGASGAFIVRASDSLKMAYEILQYPDPETGDAENVMKAIKAAGMMASGLNQYYKGALAAREGFFRDKHGNPTVRATAAEGYGKMLFGLGTFNESEYYRLKLDTNALSRARKQQARLTARALQEIYSSNSHLDSKLMTQKLKGITAYVSLLDQNEREILRPLIFEALVRINHGKVGADTLLSRIVTGSPQDFSSFKSRLKSVAKTQKAKDALDKIAELLNAKPQSKEDFIHSDKGDD